MFIYLGHSKIFCLLTYYSSDAAPIASVRNIYRPVIRKRGIIHKTGSAWCITFTTPSEVDLATATCSMHINVGEVRTCGFWDMLTDRCTDRHTLRPTSHPDHCRVIIRNSVMCCHIRELSKRAATGGDKYAVSVSDTCFLHYWLLQLRRVRRSVDTRSAARLPSLVHAVVCHLTSRVDYTATPFSQGRPRPSQTSFSE